MSRVVGLLLLAWLGRGAGTVATAQAVGVPVLAGGLARGMTLQAAFGAPNGAAGNGAAVAVSALYGGRRAGVGAFVGRRFDDHGASADYLNAGILANARLFGGPLVPFAVMLQAGAAYGAFEAAGSESGSKTRVWNVPAGIAISWLFPRPGMSIKPWVAPRVDWTRTSAPSSGGRTASTSSDFGLSGGFTLGFLNGMAIDLAYDRVFSDEARSTVGIGLGVPLP